VSAVREEAEVAELDEREEFTRWARARQSHLLRASLLLTGDRQRAEDLVQEALAKVAMRWGRLRDGSPDAYARKVMFHDHVSTWRKRRHEVLTADDGEAPVRPREPEQRIVLLAALRTLTPRQRAVVVLRYYEDLTERQAAEVLGVSVGTVKSQTHLSLKRLREAAPELAELLHEET
jgi:RNA polymerase sigma-70 factor (sigma-E family)